MSDDPKPVSGDKESSPPSVRGVFEGAGLPWILGLAFALIVGLWLAVSVCGVLLLSLATAWLLDPIVDDWEARGRRRDVGILLIFGSFLLLLAAVLLWLLPVVMQEAREAAFQLGIYLESAPERLGPWVLRVEEWLGVPLDSAALGGEGVASRSPGDWISTLFPFAFKGSVGVFVWAMNLLMFPVFTYYLLRDWDTLWEWFEGLVPFRNRTHARVLAARVDHKLAGFFWGQLMVAGILTVFYTLGLFFVGVDAAVPLGLLGGGFSLVPYLGLMVGIVTSAGVCALQFGMDWHLGATVGVFLVSQMIETFIITPRVMGERVGLHPLMVMVVLIAGGGAAGILGMLVAVPIAAIAQVLVADFLRAYRSSEFFGSAP